jgi:hypothetical protein
MSMTNDARHLKNGELLLVFRHVAGDDIKHVASQVLEILSGAEHDAGGEQSRPMLHRHGQEIQATSFVINSARDVFSAAAVANRYMSAMNYPYSVTQEFPHGEGGYILIDHNTITPPGL